MRGMGIGGNIRSEGTCVCVSKLAKSESEKISQDELRKETDVGGRVADVGRIEEQPEMQQCMVE